MDYVEELIIASLKELLELRSITEVYSNTKSKLVYPLKRDGTRRISKQEAKLIFIKHIEQLDIVDAKWDTCPTRLAEGNAEIKELISIIRCHNFQGFFTLGAGATYPGTLKKAVEEFNFLLNTM